MRAKLTKRLVDATDPAPSSDVLVWDTLLKGFGLRVKPSGKKSFFVTYYAPKLYRVQRRMTLGAYGVLTVDEARDEAKSLLGRVIDGEDPAAVRTEGERAAKEDTVRSLLEEYFEYGRAHFKKSTIADYQRLADKHILPALGRLPIASVSTRDVTRLHHQLRTRPFLANRCVQLLKAFFNWAARLEYLRGKNPAANIELFPEAERERFLTVAEMGRIGHALKLAETTGLAPAPSDRRRKPRAPADQERNVGMFTSEGQIGPADAFSIAALRFLLLTGWRKSEALTLDRSVVNFETGIATLGDTKTGKSVRVLPAPALELLAALPTIDGCRYFFPGRNLKKPLEGVRRLWDAVRYHAQLEDARLHDLRHSVASVAGGHGYSLFLIGKLLGHKSASSTERYAHLADDARKVVADTVGSAIQAALEGASPDPADHPLRRAHPKKRNRRIAR